MTEKDKEIQELRMKIEELESYIKFLESRDQMSNNYIKILEEMVKTDADARDLSDFEV